MVDEQLYGITLNNSLDNEAIESITAIRKSKKNRSFTSYGRLSSFIDQLSPIDPYILAENGLYRVPGFLNELHFHLDSI